MRELRRKGGGRTDHEIDCRRVACIGEHRAQMDGCRDKYTRRRRCRDAGMDVARIERPRPMKAEAMLQCKENGRFEPITVLLRHRADEGGAGEAADAEPRAGSERAANETAP